MNVTKTLSGCFLFIGFLAHSQHYTIIDSLTKKPVPFAAVITCNNGIYANEKGGFYFKKNTCDSISILSLGYKSKVIQKNKLTNPILLSPKNEQLSEVILTKKRRTRVLGNYRRDYGAFSWLIFPDEEFVIFLITYPPYNNNTYLKKIHIPIKRPFPIEAKQFRDKTGIFKIHLYTNDYGIPTHKIYSSQPIEFKMNRGERVAVDVSEEYLKIPKNGFYLGIELLGYINPDGIFENKKHGGYLRLKFTDKINDEFKAEVYYRNIYKQRAIISSDLLNNTYPPLKGEKNFSPAIGLTVNVYE